MIKLTDIINESNVKDDFIKALSGEKPAEVYRVHAKLKDGRIGISAWYTNAVIKDIVKDAKAAGAKIIKIEKQSGDINIKEQQQLDEGLMDSFITLIATVGAAFAVKVAGPMLVQYVSDTIGNIKSAVQGIVKPTVMQKFEKALDNDRQFSKEALQLITDRGGLDRIKNWSAFAKAVIQLPAFLKLFEKFCEENNIDKKAQWFLLVRIEYRMKETMEKYAADVVKFIKRKHPELRESKDEQFKIKKIKRKPKGETETVTVWQVEGPNKVGGYFNSEKEAKDWIKAYTDFSNSKVSKILANRWKGKDMEKYFVDKGKAHYDKLKKDLKKDINEKKKVDVTKLKKGDEIVIDMGQGKETVTVMSNFKAGISKFDFVSLKRKAGAPYTITLSRLEKAIV